MLNDSRSSHTVLAPSIEAAKRMTDVFGLIAAVPVNPSYVRFVCILDDEDQPTPFWVSTATLDAYRLAVPQKEADAIRQAVRDCAEVQSEFGELDREFMSVLRAFEIAGVGAPKSLMGDYVPSPITFSVYRGHITASLLSESHRSRLTISIERKRPELAEISHVLAWECGTIDRDDGEVNCFAEGYWVIDSLDAPAPNDLREAIALMGNDADLLVA